MSGRNEAIRLAFLIQRNIQGRNRREPCYKSNFSLKECNKINEGVSYQRCGVVGNTILFIVNYLEGS